MKTLEKETTVTVSFETSISEFQNNPPAPAAEIPAEKSQRDDILSSVKQYTQTKSLIPPLSLEELFEHADRIIVTNGADPRFRDWITVLLGNAVWENTMSAVPYERRVLLLPQCLRDKTECPAQIDEFGLLCGECGRCPTGALQSEAEALGYTVLIAEGTTVVTKLLETGKIDAVIGVSCLSALERSFPYTVAAAIPGIAIPLTQNGCDRTQVDLDWLKQSIHSKSDASWNGTLNLDTLKSQVSSWFKPENISQILNINDTGTERIAMDWIATGGKRWRPLLSVGVYQAVTDAGATIPDTMKDVAVAVECFHKASLAHDDIEDDDAERYGESTLHKKHNLPIALNIGDLLVGEGYRLIAGCGAPPDRIARMLEIAAGGHRDLCLGQGEELAWTHQPRPISVDQVLEIFRRKTAPAFEVALVLGAVCGGANGKICGILKQYSDALGTAYQIRDDIEDFNQRADKSDIRALRPSILLALALQHGGDNVTNIVRHLRHNETLELDRIVNEIVIEKNLLALAWQMVEKNKRASIRALEPLQNPRLKSLLYRIVYKILGNDAKQTV